MRICDVLFAFPGILLAIGIVAILGGGMTNVDRRGRGLQHPDVRAAGARQHAGAQAPDLHRGGAQPRRHRTRTIMLRHIFPGTISAVVVYFSLRIGTSIITAASLSFLGMGAQPPTPEWGAMLDAARADMLTAPHVAHLPGAGDLPYRARVQPAGRRAARRARSRRSSGNERDPRAASRSDARCRAGLATTHSVRILVSVDIEGVAGVVHPDHARPGNADYERARRWMTAEASAAIAGARAGGATDVIVNDSHGDFRNLLLETIDPSARLLQGKPRELGMMAGVEDGCVAVFLVGWHAKAMAAGVLAHTINSTAFARVLVNGDEAGELALYGGVAAEFGAPVAFVSGDDRCVAEACTLFPNAVARRREDARTAPIRDEPVVGGCLRRDRGRRAHGRAAHRDVAHRAAADASDRARAGSTAPPTPISSRCCRSCVASTPPRWNSRRRRCATRCAC